MTELMEFLKGFNFQTIVSMALMLWAFSVNIKGEMKSEMQKLENKIDRQAERTDKLYEMFIDLLKEGRK